MCFKKKEKSKSYIFFQKRSTLKIGRELKTMKIIPGHIPKSQDSVSMLDPEICAQVIPVPSSAVQVRSRVCSPGDPHVPSHADQLAQVFQKASTERTKKTSLIEKS